MLSGRVSFLFAGTALLAACVFVPEVYAADDAHYAADSSHGDGHHEGSSAGLPQLDATTFPSQLFWLAIMFTALYLTFSRRLLPEISSVLENRQQHIEGDLETAETLRNEAETARSNYEAGLEDARSQSMKILSEMQDKMKTAAQKKGDEFRKKSEKEIEELEERLMKAKDAAMEDMHTIAAEVASEAARKIVGIDPGIEQARTVVKSINGSRAKAA